MILDRVANISSSFVWSIILARQLGLVDFGNYNTVVAMIGIFVPIAACGLNGYLNKLLIGWKENTKLVINTALHIKLLSGVVCLSLSLLCIRFIVNFPINFSIIMYSFILVFQCAQAFESLFQSYSRSIITTYVRLVVVVLFLLIKLYFYSVGSLTLEVALIIQSAELIFYYSIVFICGIRAKEYGVFNGKRTNTQSTIKVRALRKIMLSGGSVLILSGFAEIINLKIDVVMLAYLSGANEVAIYSVATKISEAGYFFSAIIATSYFPLLLAKKKISLEVYYSEVRSIKIKLLSLSLIVGMIILISSYYLIGFFYGEEYNNSFNVLAIHILASGFVYVRAAFSKWIIAEDKLKYSIYTHVFGALVNVILNFILIPYYSYYGAAISTVVSYMFSSHISLYFFSDTREYLKNTKLYKTKRFS